MSKMAHLSQIALQNQTDSNENPTQKQSPPSLPLLPLSSSQDSYKPKRKPTVTPRTFTRFFTPRSSIGRDKIFGSSRQILRDITTSGSNQTLSTPIKGTLTAFSQVKSEPTNLLGKRKRRTVVSPAISLDQSSPLRKKGSLSIKTSQGNTTESAQPGSEDQPFDSNSKKETYSPASMIKKVKPVVFARLPGAGGPFNTTFRRELLGMDGIQGNQCIFPDYRSEVACFYSTPHDTCTFSRSSQQGTETVTPFCTTGCNTNSLVAVGDEDGRITLLDSADKVTSTFSQAFLAFSPHSNAILDLCFSFDDLRLATAAGDRTAKIINMYGQKTTHILRHDDAVKQVRFQPGSSNIVASSTRSGNVFIWDLRCKDGPVQGLKVSFNPPSRVGGQASAGGHTTNEEARCIHGLYDVHGFKTGTLMNWATLQTTSSVRYASRPQSLDERSEVSVTSLSFLNAGRENLFVTGSESNASIKLWDIRKMRSHRRHNGTPLSSTAQPESHLIRNRSFGLTSLVFSGDGKRLYSLCRDNTVYAYTTSHLLSGHAPELSSSNSQPRKSDASNQLAPGPIYGFEDPAIKGVSFYVRLAIRSATAANSELLAVGGHQGAPILFHTDERYFNFGPTGPRPAPPQSSQQIQVQEKEAPAVQPPPRHTPIPVYQSGVQLSGHKHEVTGLTWTHDGDLVSVCDDSTAKCWRQGKNGEAKSLRARGKKDVTTWGFGWADVHESWDNDGE